LFLRCKDRIQITNNKLQITIIKAQTNFNNPKFQI